MAHMDEFKKFEVLCEKAKKAISSLPSAVKESFSIILDAGGLVDPTCDCPICMISKSPSSS